jgi:hypothetical protein
MAGLYASAAAEFLTSVMGMALPACVILFVLWRVESQDAERSKATSKMAAELMTKYGARAATLEVAIQRHRASVTAKSDQYDWFCGVTPDDQELWSVLDAHTDAGAARAEATQESEAT